MRTLFVLVVLLACIVPALVSATDDPVGALASEPSYSLDIVYNADTQTIEGSFDLQLSPEANTVYFSLLANLDSHPNPYVSPRQQDAVYPDGFEPSRISVLTVEIITGDQAEAIPFHLLSMPPSWQTYSLDDTVLAVELPVTDSHTPITLRCRFITEVPRTTLGDQAVTHGILTWRFGWFPMLFPEQSLIVEREGVIGYEGKDSLPLVFPWVRLSAKITVPAGSQLIVGADSIEELAEPETAKSMTSPETARSTEGLSQDEQVRSYVVQNDSPSRSLAMTVGTGYESYRLESMTNVEVFYLPHHEADARLIATLALDILANYIPRYGPYPRSSLTIVENPSAHGQAFAADGIVWLSSRFFTHRNVLFPGALDRVIEYVLAHEIAHQWVGLGTGIDLDAEAWLSEGLAQYLAVRYFEDRYGSFEPNVFAPQVPGIVGEFVTQQWGFFNLREHFVELPYLLTTRAGFDEELIKATENVQFGNAESVRLYDKGYLVARAMAAKIGFASFERALARAIVERRADLLDARSFQALLEEESGQSLAEFFDFWVFGPGSADYAIHILDRTVENGIHTTRVSVSRDGGVEQPVIVEATMRSEGTVRQEWEAVGTTAVLEFKTPTIVTRVSIDPDHNLPDTNRLNNHAPVKIVGAANEKVLPLDAYVLAPDQAKGGIIFSHLDRFRISVSQTEASASVKLERSHQLSMTTSFTTPQLTGHIAYTTTAYGQPETGSAATYWEPTFTFTTTVMRFVYDGEPGLALMFTATHLSSIADSGSRSVMLRLAPQGVGQIELITRYDIRVFPGVYLMGTARIGTSTGIVPQPLQFSVSELHSFLLPPSNHVAAAKIALELPSPNALPYSLLHLAMIDGSRSRLFITAGAGWTNPDEFGTTSPSIEAGMEQLFDLSTLGGLISLTAQIGIATPILGEGITTLYGGVSF
jgi:hypothetical protein